MTPLVAIVESFIFHLFYFISIEVATAFLTLYCPFSNDLWIGYTKRYRMNVWIGYGKRYRNDKVVVFSYTSKNIHSALSKVICDYL